MRRKRIAAGMLVLAVLMVASAAIGLTLFFGKQTAASAAGVPNKDVQLASPLQPLIYLEGRIEQGVECGCRFLVTVDSKWYELWGDLEGFTCGDEVAVWATVCSDCFSICMQGRIVLVQDIAALPPTPTPTPVPTLTAASPVGGIAQLPDVSDSSGRNYIHLSGLAAAALVALTAGAWYARRRRLG